MGKWAEVPCVCPNRIPLDGNNAQLDRPYRKKHRLTKQQQQEVELWQRTKENMYQCGHRNGMIFEIWPGDIIELNRCLAESFDRQFVQIELFAKVGNPRNYEDELLQLTAHEARNWLEGLTTVEGVLAGRVGVDPNFLGRLLGCVLSKEAASWSDLQGRFDQVQGSWAPVQRLKEEIQASHPPTFEAVERTISNALQDPRKLCVASISTGTPIYLRW